MTLAAANTMFASAARAEPKRGGTFKIGVAMAPPPTTWTRAFIRDQFTGTACGTLANSLTEIDADGNVVGDVAEIFEPSRRRQEVGVQGAEGHHLPQWTHRHCERRPRLADASPQRDSKSAAKSLLKEIVSMKADGTDTVVIELSGGNADFPYTVSDYHRPIMPRTMTAR